MYIMQTIEANNIETEILNSFAEQIAKENEIVHKGKEYNGTDNLSGFYKYYDKVENDFTTMLFLQKVSEDSNEHIKAINDIMRSETDFSKMESL